MEKKVFRKNLIILIAMNLSLVVFAVVYTLIFENSSENKGKLFGCAFKETFSLYCPGCGGSRSLSALMKFDFAESFILYPPIIISAITIFEYDVRLILSLVFKNTKFTDRYRFYTFILIPVSVFLTFIVRNLLLVFFGIDTVGDFF